MRAARVAIGAGGVLCAVLLLGTALYAQTTLTFVQAQAKADLLWPGKAVTAEVHRSGITSIERWVGYLNDQLVFVPCMKSTGTNWATTMAIAPICVDSSVAPPAPPDPFTLEPPVLPRDWYVDGPFLVEDQDLYRYVARSITPPESPALPHNRERLHAALCELRAAYNGGAPFDAFFLSRGVKLRYPCAVVAPTVIAPVFTVGEDLVGIYGQLTPDGVPDWHVQINGVPPVRVVISGSPEGMWESPFTGTLWSILIRPGVSPNTTELVFEPWVPALRLHIQAWYSDGTMKESDVDVQ